MVSRHVYVAVPLGLRMGYILSSIVMIIGQYRGIECPYLVDSNSEDSLRVRLPVIIQYSQHLLLEIGTQTGYRHGIIGVVRVSSYGVYWYRSGFIS